MPCCRAHVPLLLLCLAFLSGTGPRGPWRAALDLAGGELRFSLVTEEPARGGRPALQRRECQAFSAIRVRGRQPGFELADYAATISAAMRGDSLVGQYRNVGRRGPRTIPFRAPAGTWRSRPGARAAGRWDAWFVSGSRPRRGCSSSRTAPAGLEGTIISNSGDYGQFWGGMVGDSFAIAHFDGSFVYLLAGRLDGDTLRGIFHAGLRSQTPFVAVRSTGRPHLTPPTEVTRADTADPSTSPSRS